MKLIKLNNALLLIRLDVDNDIARCYFIYFINWVTFKIDFSIINLNTTSISLIKKMYENLTSDFNNKYQL